MDAKDLGTDLEKVLITEEQIAARLREMADEIGRDYALDQSGEQVPFVELDGRHYKLVDQFDRRFPDGAPSLREAQSLTVEGDWTFGKGVRVVGEVKLQAGKAQRVAPGTVLDEGLSDG